MRKLTIALSVAVALARPVRAAWGKAEWGMSLSEVQELYPGGKRSGPTYAVQDQLAGRKVVVTFKVGPDGLQQVVIAFLKAGSKVDLAAAQERDTIARARKTWDDVRALLETQHGKPATRSDDLAAWSTPTDSIVLTRTDDEAARLSRVVVTFMPASAVDEGDGRVPEHRDVAPAGQDGDPDAGTTSARDADR